MGVFAHIFSWTFYIFYVCIWISDEVSNTPQTGVCVSVSVSVSVCVCLRVIVCVCVCVSVRVVNAQRSEGHDKGISAMQVLY